ncbi:MAG: DUF3426 domain-containing protein, partial [Alphaproteobacteria bacterium]|nr:DUF3426 domain-containing protein [Alphaproteobacteria bacterium]
LGDTGRTVRCSKCGETWFQSPEQPLEDAAPVVETPVEPDFEPEPPPESEPEPEPEQEQEPEPEPEPEPDLDGPEEDSEDDDSADTPQAPELLRSAAMRRQQAAPGMPGWIGWAALAAVIVVVAAATALLRDPIVAAWPNARLLYTTVGLPLVPPEPELEIRSLAPVRTTEAGESVLVIEGEILNMSSTAKPVPPIRVVLRDEDQQDLAAWTFEAYDVNMVPREIVAFKTSYPDPPDAAVGAFLSFATPE